MFRNGVINRNPRTVASISDALREIDFRVREQAAAEQAAAMNERSGKG
jgi:hypothetical protein